ncbi:hypothetical protein ACRARG_12565 [Pseudooceanicola sp. C21-150M6]|uniref:hypothetical protein n=1 Tax=Pseudooceanicola sp. C21-150M6 TaxID=3434355 RepID=UPI003D7F8D90
MSKFYGTTSRKIDGKDLRFVLDFNAICHFEQTAKVNFFDSAEAWEAGKSPSGFELRAIVHAALQQNHPELTAEDAGRILSQDMSIFSDLQSTATEGMDPAAGNAAAADA